MIKGVLKTIYKSVSDLIRPRLIAQLVEVQVDDLLKGRKALVTGGGGGIGFAIAKAFLKAGADVVICGRNEEKLKAACEQLSAFGRVAYLRADMTKISTFDTVINDAVSKIGGLDLLVNNAGVNGGRFDATDEIEFDKIIETNLKGYFFMSRSFAKYMIQHKKTGNILNVASSSSMRPAISAYTLSKWGVRGLTLGLAKSLITHNIVVNGIAPGQTATPMLHIDPDEDISLPQCPAQRYALPEEIANFSVYLVSKAGSMIVGDIVYMTGGAGLVSYEDIKYDLNF